MSLYSAHHVVKIVWKLASKTRFSSTKCGSNGRENKACYNPKSHGSQLCLTVSPFSDEVNLK